MNSVERVNRSVIEKKLLTALQEDGVVAILATEEDLEMLIDALSNVPRRGYSSKAEEWSLSLQQLKREAFPKPARA